MVAEAAVLIMRPRGGIEPVDVAPQTYFSASFIERAEDFRSGQLWLFGARMALELGLLVYVVRAPAARACSGRVPAPGAGRRRDRRRRSSVAVDRAHAAGQRDLARAAPRTSGW